MLNSRLERNLLSDPLLRFGIRRLLAQRLREENKGGAYRAYQRTTSAFVPWCKQR